MNKPCTLPPPGWSCSRDKGHDGPCAASPTTLPSPDKWDALRKAAEAASKGKWKHFYAKSLRQGFKGNPINEVQGPTGDPLVHWTGFDACNQSHAQRKRNAAYIALANPTVILELLSELRERGGEGQIATLIAALREIADPARPGNASMCECEHDTLDCCAVNDFYCPQCIAGRALATLSVTEGVDGREK